VDCLVSSSAYTGIGTPLRDWPWAWLWTAPRIMATERRLAFIEQFLLAVNAWLDWLT
jgi:hypothetical protein